MAGYFNKIIHSDIFVILEQVQFRKNYFQNRTKIKANNQAMWLTFPVKKSSERLISEIDLVNDERNKIKIIRTLEQAYSKTEYFDTYFPDFKEIILNDDQKLSIKNTRLLYKSLEILDIKTKIEFSHNLASSLDPNLRLIEICKNLNSGIYISGAGGKNYLKKELFKENGIKILWQEFNQEIFYNQRGESFLPGLSFLDALFNIGSKKTKKLIFDSWNPKK